MTASIRFDDLAADPPVSWEFAGVVAADSAETLDDVLSCLAAADRQARVDQRWVVLVVAYEAAAAFDAAARTAPTPPDGVPFVWWRAYEDRRRAEPPAFRPSPVLDRTRSENVMAFPDAVRHVRSRIAAGDVYQVNVTDRIRGGYDGDPIDVYRALTGVQSCSHGAYIDMGSVVVASASPELFFRWDDDGTITCRPMKGTAPRHPRSIDDRRAGARLRASDKERAENVMIVDLMRNDLSRVALPGTVRVPELFAVERYETVWQLTSTVQADVSTDMSLIDVLGALFPCGSVTGAPKLAAMSVIDELEREPRGVYCGAIGYLSPPGAGPRAEFSVPIRTAVIDPATRTYVYGSGGGITWSSDPHAEDDEVQHKARILTRSRRELELLETMLHDRDGIAHVDRHLDRLVASADWFGVPCDRAGLEALLASRPPVSTPQRLRLLVSAVGADRGTARVDESPLNELPSPVRLAVDTVVTRSDDPFCCHKTTFRRHYDEARARHPGSDDVVLVNECGRVIETTIGNLVYRLEGRWWVPPLDDGGLAGVGRAVALDDGWLCERPLHVDDLRHCDELAVLNALRGVRPAILS